MAKATKDIIVPVFCWIVAELTTCIGTHLPARQPVANIGISKDHKLSSYEINPILNGLQQDNPFLIDILRHRYIVSPSNAPYNISIPSKALNGQFGQARYVADTYLR